MAAVSLDAYHDSFKSGTCKLIKNCGIINVSFSIENSLKWLTSYVHLEFINHDVI